MAKNIQPTIETGAMTLVLLVKNYRSQMIALLLKNGVTVPNGASSQQIASLMANLLKFSKSFAMDLQKFISNPKVMEVLAGGMTENAQYFKMSGNAQYFRASGFMNSTGGEDGYTDTGEPAPSGTPPKTGFFGGLNFGNLFSQVLDGFGKYDKNQTDRAIANAQAQVGANVGGNTNVNTGGNTGGGGKDDDPDTKMNTTTIVILSLVGVAVLGTIIYFVARPKE